MRLTDLRVNHLETPLGFQIRPLSFSWKVVDIGAEKRQRWARITIWESGTCLFDSGEDIYADSLDYPVNIDIKPRTAYVWKLNVCTESGTILKAQSHFETGMMETDWIGKWITPKNFNMASVILSKKFTLSTKAQTARIYLCGLGVYELYINGKKVGKEYLAPGYHSYDLHLQAQTYDAAPYLKAGDNELQIWLGDGWFKGRFGFDGGYNNLYGDRLYAIGELHIRQASGEEKIISTDKTWECKQSPITFSNIYDGEIYDANIDMQCTCDSVSEQEPKNCGHLNDRYSLPIVKKDKFVPREIIHTKNGETVLDFGQNLTGWIEFDATLPQGEQITFTASEIMQDGNFYHENFRTAKTEFTYISNGKKRHVRPHFTFYGFRYMKVTCTDMTWLSEIAAYHLRSDFEQIGEIRTGNEKVNRLFLNALWSQKDNFLDVPTDCPQRDERMGWTGDAQVFSETACYNMYVPAFFRKYLWDMRAEQELIGGSVPNVVPRLKEGMVSEHGASPWADAGVIIPWNLYQFYGNQTMLSESYEGMKAWVEYQRKRAQASCGAHLIQEGFHFADWLALDNEEPGPFGKTDPFYIASAYYYHCTSIVAQAANILGMTEDAKDYQKLCAAILKDIQAAYFENGICTCKTQTASALAIAFGLSPEKQREEGHELQKRVQTNGNHLNTGFVGTTMLCPALTATGNHKTAVDLLLNEDYPSWLYSVNLGATTIWERWDSVLADGHISSEGMNSLNHYSYGSIAAWMYGDVCGIRPLAAGFRRAKITPHPDQRLKFAECTLDTAAGTYVSRWNYQTDGRVVYDIEIPFHTEAVIILPKGIYKNDHNIVFGETRLQFETGNYQFVEQKERK